MAGSETAAAGPGHRRTHATQTHTASLVPARNTGLICYKFETQQENLEKNMKLELLNFSYGTSSMSAEDRNEQGSFKSMFRFINKIQLQFV